MTSFTKEFFSESTSGRHINITASGTPGDLVHTATNTAGVKDEIWLYANNNSLFEAVVTVEWGGTTDPDDLHVVGIPAQQGDVLVIAGKPMAGGLNTRVFTDQATLSGVNISGWVNRIDENG